MKLTIGTQLNYTGDAQNQPDVATIIDVVDSEIEGTTYRVFMHDTERFEYVNENNISSTLSWRVKPTMIWVVEWQLAAITNRQMRLFAYESEANSWRDGIVDAARSSGKDPLFLVMQKHPIQGAVGRINAFLEH